MRPNITKYERFLLDASQPAKRYYIRVLEALQTAHLAFAMSPASELNIDMDLGGFGRHAVRVYDMGYKIDGQAGIFSYVLEWPRKSHKWGDRLPSLPDDIAATLAWAQAMYPELFV